MKIRMEKRGQVTVFIIVGIMIVLLSLGFFLVKNSFLTESLAAEEKGLPVGVVQSTVESCLERSTKDALVIVGKQGGYYKAPLDSEFLFGSYVPYYVYEGEDAAPDLEDLEKQLSLAVSDLLPECLDQIVEFHAREGVVVEYRIDRISAMIRDDAISLEGNIPVAVRLKEEQKVEAELSHFAVTLEVQYKELYEFSTEIARLQKTDLQWFMFGDLSDLSYKSGIQFEILAPQQFVSEREETGAEIVPDNDQEDYNKILISLVSRDFFDEPYYYTFGILFDADYDAAFSKDAELEETMLQEVDLALAEE